MKPSGNGGVGSFGTSAKGTITVGYPGRALRNDFYQRWHGNEEQLQIQRADVEKSYLATKPDDFSARVIWAGEGVDLVKDVPSAADLIERTIAEAVSVLTRGARLVL